MLRKQAIDIRRNLQEGLLTSQKQRVKTVSKDEHRMHHVKRKTDMKSIFDKQPLVVRKDMKIPTYPKLNYSNSTSLRSIATDHNITPPKQSRVGDVTESKDRGLITDT